MDFTPGHSQPHHLHHQSQQLPQPGPHPQDQQNQQNEQNQHQHHYHANGLPTSGASRCPALHPAFPHHSYQLPAPTAQSSAHYGPPALNSREAYWQARSRHTWLPNSLPDGFPMDSSQGQHAFLNQTNPSNQMQPRLPCPAPITNVADMSGPSYMLQRHYTAMHPPPHFPSLNQAGYDSLNWRQPDGQLHPNRYGHGANSAFPNQGPARFGPLSQRSSAVPSPTTGPRRIFVSDENTRPAAIPSLLTDAAADADSTNSMSQHAPGHSEPAAETRVAVDADNPLPASPSASMPISAAPEQPNHHITERVDENANVQASHIENPVQVHRLAFANTSRPRRATSSRSAAGYEMAIRAGGLELLDFADGHQGIYSDWEGPRFNVSLGKKLASRRALETLLSVDIASLPASERTCVICYNEFGVASPEGTNEAPLKLPKCKHVFGDHCIKKWFEESDTCPYCRDKVYQPTLRGPYPWQYLQRSYLSDHHIGSFRGIARGQGQSRSQGTQTQTQIQQLLSLSRAHDQNVPEQGFAELGRIIPEFSSPDPIFDDSMSMSSDPGSEGENRSPPSVRRVGNQNQNPLGPHHHSPRVPSLAFPSLGPGRRSPSRRTRHRGRHGYAPPSSVSIFGVPSNGSALAPVRPPRNSRSRSRSRSGSPLRRRPWGLTGNNRQPLTGSPEQYQRRRSMSSESSQAEAQVEQPLVEGRTTASNPPNPQNGPSHSPSRDYYHSHLPSLSTYNMQRRAPSYADTQAMNEQILMGQAEHF